MVLKRFFAPAVAPVYVGPPGRRLYAVGDIHGRCDLFDALLARIEADAAARPALPTTLVLLGDLVDRGPDSASVVARAMGLAQERETVLLAGNHEEVMLRTWDADRSSAGLFARIGGRETLLSYGVSEDEYDAAGLTEVIELTRRHVPATHIDFLRGFTETYAAGDYLFVHAGIRPGVPIEEQRSADTRWIRREFLEHTRDHGMMVVHGHSITANVEERDNRIGIDTGAYASGRLTAIGIEGEARWFLTT